MEIKIKTNDTKFCFWITNIKLINRKNMDIKFYRRIIKEKVNQINKERTEKKSIK